MPKTATERAGASLASFGITPELMVGCDRCGTDHRADQFTWRWVWRLEGFSRTCRLYQDHQREERKRQGSLL